jgi:hypothetical protein
MSDSSGFQKRCITSFLTALQKLRQNERPMEIRQVLEGGAKKVPLLS